MGLEISSELKKVLFVSSFIGQANTGGAVASKRNLELCRMIFPDLEVDAFGFSFPGTPPIEKVNLLPSYNGKVQTLLNYLLGYTGGLTGKNFQGLKKQLSDNQYSSVFLDGSLLGTLAAYIKHHYPSVTIILFCHNVEYDFFKAASQSNRMYYLLFLKAASSEKKAVKSAHRVLAFNSRDAGRLVELYKLAPPLIFPITLSDRFECARITKGSDVPFQLLFVGSSFYANIEGIRWFCKEVMTKVNVHLQIVGNGMQHLGDELSSSKIAIAGSVADLDPYYYQADAVVIPIFSGSGMKVKTAEALMMGKTVLGSAEAWQGYDFDNSGGFLCYTASDFITAINSVAARSGKKLNDKARALFLAQYSDQSLQSRVADLKSIL